MEVQVPTKQEFMRKFKRYEPVILDHSAVIQAKQCKRKYFYRIVLGFSPKVTPQYFGFGSCYHKFREVLEKEFMKRNAALKDWVEAYKLNPDSAGPRPQDPMEVDVQMQMFGTALQAATDLWKRKKMQDPPAGDRWDFMTQARLLESCATAFKWWQKEKQQGRIEVLAVEQNFIVQLPDGSYTAGKADQIIKWNNKIWGRDFKTSSKEQNSYFTRTLDPNDQFIRYTFAEAELCGQPVQGQLVEVLYNGKSTKKEQKGPSIHSHISSRSDQQIKQWVKEQMFYNKIFQLMRDEDTYPMEEKSCSFCEYHSVCTKPSEQSQMAKLEAEFKVEPWDCTNRVDMDD